MAQFNIFKSYNAKKESALFLLIFLLELIFTLFLIIGHRLPGGHDGFQYFSLQYYFLNNVVTSGEIPQWMPFMTHGTVATWWYAIQGGLLQIVLLFTGSLLKHVNFLTVFNIGVFIDELLLLIGVWLLARRFFSSSYTVFFVTVTAMGSCIWMTQVWCNFHFYYAIPLILHFFHSFLEHGKWRYFLLAGNLLVVQNLGNVPYFMSLTSLIIFLYFLFYSIFNYREVWQQVKNLKWGLPFFACLFVVIISFVAAYAVMNIGTSQIVNYNLARQVDGTISLEGYLAYAGKLNLVKWIEFFLGVSPFLDYTVYIGYLSLPLVILGLIFNLKRRNLHFLFLALAVLLFGTERFVATFFYYSWPFMKFFRHRVLVCSMVKLFLCFLAGFGFETLFVRKFHWRGLIPSAVVVLTALLIFGIAGVLFNFSSNYDSSLKLMHKITDSTHDIMSGLPGFNKIFDKDILSPRLSKSAFFAFISAILVGILPFIKRKRIPLEFVLALYLFDIYGYKFSELYMRTIPLNNEEYKITAFQAMPYAKRRDLSFWENNPRALILIDPIKSLSLHRKYGSLDGVLYWTTHSFLFKDQLGNPFRTDHWLVPLDNFMRTYWGQSIHDLSTTPAGLFYFEKLEFPSQHPAAGKIAGVTEDKIQFFSKAYIIDTDDLIVSKIRDSNYAGDILFLSRLGSDKKASSNALLWSPDQSLSSNMRLRVSYQVLRFDSNNLEIIVNMPQPEPSWMLYSDVWHPFWKATVNGRLTQVSKANLAYKAIQLERGLNKVHFYFNSNPMSLLHLFLDSMLCFG